MADTEEKTAAKLREITECPICKSTFKDPRMLPCIHTFCLECLKCTGEALQKKPGDKMSCPMCRKEFTIPKGGVDGLQKNFFIENLMEFKKMLQISSASVKCDLCIIRNEGKTEQTSAATTRCLDCKDNYCDGCSKVHQKQKLSINHRVVKLGKEIEEEKRRMISVTFCKRHTGKPLDYYCANCKKIVCASCIVEGHNSHNCKDVTTVEKEFRQMIEKNAFKISANSDETLTQRKKTEKRKKDFLKEIVEKENAIRKRSVELKKLIDENTKSLLQELSLIKSNHLKKIETEMEEIDRCWTIQRTFEAYCTELRMKGSASDICSSVDEILDRTAELQKDHEAFICRPHNSVEVSFQTTDLEEVVEKSNRNIVGQIQETSAKYENYAMIVGLTDGKTKKRDVVQINLHRTYEISTLQQIPTEFKLEATAAVYRNTMFVAGIGYNADSIWKYNVASGWIKCASLVQGRRGHSAAFIGEVLYICGGMLYSDERVLDSVEAYNAVTDKCCTVGKLVHCVESSGNCVPFRSSLYIFGGTDKDDISMNHVQVYRTNQNTCSVLSTPMPSSYYLMRAALWETSVILIGYSTCLIFNFDTETWQERRQLKTDVLHFGLVLENENIFVIGGETSEKGLFAKSKWKCRDDVRYIPVQNILGDKPTEWKIHAKLPQPSLVFACEKLSSFIPK